MCILNQDDFRVLSEELKQGTLTVGSKYLVKFNLYDEGDDTESYQYQVLTWLGGMKLVNNRQENILDYYEAEDIQLIEIV